ncbi:MAG: Zn-dependent hydrolase [Corynebacteriales bacterium]|nr:Zn-dependent hydrolase [Mycobacteriales bacterium]
MRKSTVLGMALGAAAVGAAAWIAADLRKSFGGEPDGDEMKRSPQFKDGIFHNVSPAHPIPVSESRSMIAELLFGKQRREPSGPVPLAIPITAPAPKGLHITWYGHASSLVEIDGARVLLDPVWSERCSPSQLAGPRRLHPTPVSLQDVGPVDAVVISHDHYDHLDMRTILTLTKSQASPFVVPLGVGAHLRKWGVPGSRIIELDWHEGVDIAGLRLTATPAQHFSGRLFTRNNTLWASWVIASKQHRVFYTGDSGYFDGYATIGAEYGPFDATLVQIGAYNTAWPDIHMTPEEGVATHLDLNGGLMIPVHWATFKLAMHSWTEPADRLWREAKARNITLAVPRPGERVDVSSPGEVDGWWQALA